jgi:2-polyprenyl-3-methyl-5-hydroxy-6-metoxy-1,4-benzoquinol methylase
MTEQHTKEHFDEIAAGYNEEISCHIRDHLINKWWEIVSCHFAGNPRVIDIGCGDGTNVKFMRDKGVNAIGMDFSSGLIAAGRERYPEL